MGSDSISDVPLSSVAKDFGRKKKVRFDQLNFFDSILLIRSCIMWFLVLFFVQNRWIGWRNWSRASSICAVNNGFLKVLYEFDFFFFPRFSVVAILFYFMLSFKFQLKYQKIGGYVFLRCWELWIYNPYETNWILFLKRDKIGKRREEKKKEVINVYWIFRNYCFFNY